jgi:hypothetical protein
MKLLGFSHPHLLPFHFFSPFNFLLFFSILFLHFHSSFTLTFLKILFAFPLHFTYTFYFSITHFSLLLLFYFTFFYPSKAIGYFGKCVFGKCGQMNMSLPILQTCMSTFIVFIFTLENVD